MPQQGLWPCPGPLAGKQARGDGGVRARPPLAHAPVLRLGAASRVGLRLPGPARPVELWELGQWGCQGLGGCAWRRAGMVPCLGSSGIWLLLAHSVFEASYLTGPCWLAAILLSRSVREGSP